MTSPSPNVVVVVIDALRPDYVTESTAPWLLDLASSGVTFENAFSPINATEPLLASFYTGKYPRTTGVYNHGTNLTRSDFAVLHQETFVQERFQSEGYETIAFDWLGRWHETGYDLYSGQIADHAGSNGGGEPGRNVTLAGAARRRILKWTPPSAMAHIRRMKHRIFPPRVEPEGWLPDSADVVVEATLKEQEARPEPFYLFVHLWDTHSPYDVPEEYADEFGDPDDPIARYRAGIAFVDEQLSILHDELERRTARDTLYLVMGDHGESLGEHGIYFDHHGLYDVSLRVPMILDHPALPGGTTVEEFVQHVDLNPTLVDFCFGESAEGVDGYSLLPTIFDDAPTRDRVYSEEAHTQRKAAVRTERYKYIETIGESSVCRGCHVVHGGERELYDVERDPGETENLVEVEQELASELSNGLHRWRESTPRERERIVDAVSRLASSDRWLDAL